MRRVAPVRALRERQDRRRSSRPNSIDSRPRPAQAGDAFDRAYWQLDETEVRIDKTDKKIAVTQKKLTKAKRRLSLHAASIYRRGDYSLFEFVMGASSFDDFVTRMDYLRRIGRL